MYPSDDGRERRLTDGRRSDLRHQITISHPPGDKPVVAIHQFGQSIIWRDRALPRRCDNGAFLSSNTPD